MALITSRFVHFNKKTDFDSSLQAGDIQDESIVFIKDSNLIYTHGAYYNGKDFTTLISSHTSNKSNPHSVNGSQVTLTGYTKGSYSSITASDTTNSAIGKLEDGISAVEVELTENLSSVENKIDNHIGDKDNPHNTIVSNIPMTGYLKGTEYTPLSSSEKLNTAIGKLEAGVEDLIRNTGSISTVEEKIDEHIVNKNNPHQTNGSNVLLTGYTKGSSDQQISASDSTNSAIGKLEYKVDSLYDSTASIEETLTEAVGQAQTDIRSHTGDKDNPHETNGSNIPMTGYFKAPAYTPVSTSDKLNSAIGKLDAGISDLIVKTANIEGIESKVDSHTSNTNNPHGVNGSQVILKGFTTPGELTSYPLSNITATTSTNEAIETLYTNIRDNTNEISSHLTNKSNPHSVNGSQVKLTNYSKQPAYTPISTTNSVNDGLGKLEAGISDLIIRTANVESHVSNKSNPHRTTSMNATIGSGYSKATSESAITTSDKIGTAIGKLEYKVDNPEKILCQDFTGTTLELEDYINYDVVCLRLTSTSTSTFTIKISDTFCNSMTSGGISYSDRTKAYEKIKFYLYIPTTSFASLTLTPYKSITTYSWSSVNDGYSTVTVDGSYNVATNMGTGREYPKLRRSTEIEVIGFRPGSTNFISIVGR